MGRIKTVSLLIVTLLLMSCRTSPDQRNSVRLDFTPTEIEVGEGIIVRIVQGDQERVDILCDDIETVECKLDRRSGTVHLHRHLKGILSFLWMDLGDKKCIATIVTRDPSTLRRIATDSSASVEVEGEGIRFGALSLEADSSGEITVEGDGRSLSIDASSSSSIRVDGDFDELRVDASSSSSVLLLGRYGDCTFDVTSSARVEAEGSADYADVECDSSGTFVGGSLVAQRASLEASSSGRIKITCKGTVERQKSSSGGYIVVL